MGYLLIFLTYLILPAGAGQARPGQGCGCLLSMRVFREGVSLAQGVQFGKGGLDRFLY